MAGLIRFLLIVLLVYLVAILFLRYIFPFVLRLFVRRLSNRVRKQYEQESGHKNNQKKGNVTIDYQPGTKKKIDKNTGDYISYEEVDE